MQLLVYQKVAVRAVIHSPLRPLLTTIVNVGIQVAPVVPIMHVVVQAIAAHQVAMWETVVHVVLV